MRRLALIAATFVACSKSEPPPPPPPPAPVVKEAPPPPTEAPLPAGVSDWKPPLDAASLKALDSYAGFSGDGLVFGYTEYSQGAGAQIFSFVSATTNTVEKTVVLATPEARGKLAQELSEEGYPKPGALPKVPSVFATHVEDRLVSVTFSGMPAAKPFEPFADLPQVKLGAVDVVAASRDGKRVAVRCASAGAITEFGAGRVFRVVTLFE